jgi:hypothetical protein
VNPTLADVVNREWVKRYGGEPVESAAALESRVVQLCLDRDSWLPNAKSIQKECNRLEALLRPPQ